jgi:hypothetical protein
MKERHDEHGPVAGERVRAAKAMLDDFATMSVAACEGAEPWIGKAFFVEDEPREGRFDMCCCLIAAKTLAMIERNPNVAFMVGGDQPDRWLQGTGSAEAVTDDADAAAILKRLEEKTPAAGDFLRKAQFTAVRIHVERMTLTQLSASPPVTEFTFA